MIVANNFFENGIAFFTRLVNTSISWVVANGDVGCFVGHNAFIRWSALQEIAQQQPDGRWQIWSERCVALLFLSPLRSLLARLPLIPSCSSTPLLTLLIARSHVSEDFDCALRMLVAGCVLALALFPFEGPQLTPTLAATTSAGRPTPMERSRRASRSRATTSSTAGRSASSASRSCAQAS